MNKKLITNGGNSLCEAIKNMKNKDLAVNLSKSKCDFVIGPNENPDLNEAEDKYSKWLFSGESGGTIIFSTDVNSKSLSDNKFKDWILKKFKTFKNRNFASKILDKIRRKNDVYAWTIGRYLVGTYTGEDNKTYDENSLCLNVIGVDKDLLFRLAEEIRDAFDQESVLVQVAETKQIYFVN